jgi:DNA-binding MarR family transcriptional regulator
VEDHFLQFTIAISKLNKQVQKLKTAGMGRFDLKGVHTLCLYQLMAHPEGLTFSRIAADCDLDQALVSRTLADLVQQGLVAKSGLPGKYNASYALTPRGADITHQVRAMVFQVQTLADEGISPEELDTFYRVLDRLVDNFQAMTSLPGGLFAPEEEAQNTSTKEEL